MYVITIFADEVSNFNISVSTKYCYAQDCSPINKVLQKTKEIQRKISMFYVFYEI